MMVRPSMQPMWKSLWASSSQVGIREVVQLVAVGPGGSGVWAARA